MKGYKDWAKASRTGEIGPLYLWNYYHHPEEIGVMREHNVFPQFSAHHIAELSRMYGQDKVRGIFLCGWGEGLDFYVTMKTFDDPTQDIERLLDHYFNFSFGPAATPMRTFYERIETISTSPEYYPREGNLGQRVFWELQGNRQTLEELQTLLREAKKLAAAERFQPRLAPWQELMEYLWDGHNQWRTQRQALTRKAPHDSVLPGYIHPVEVISSRQDKPPYTLITGFHMVESSPGVFGTQDALLDIRNDADRHWHGWGPDGQFVQFDLGGLYQLDEIRIWNYQQNRGYGLTRRGMRQARIEGSDTNELSSWRVIKELELPIGDDRNAFPPSATIKGGARPVRYVRITAVGKPGEGNWSLDGADTAVGLGQVRFYGMKR